MKYESLCVTDAQEAREYIDNYRFERLGLIEFEKWIPAAKIMMASIKPDISITDMIGDLQSLITHENLYGSDPYTFIAVPSDMPKGEDKRFEREEQEEWRKDRERLQKYNKEYHVEADKIEDMGTHWKALINEAIRTKDYDRINLITGYFKDTAEIWLPLLLKGINNISEEWCHDGRTEYDRKKAERKMKSLQKDYLHAANLLDCVRYTMKQV